MVLMGLVCNGIFELNSSLVCCKDTSGVSLAFYLQSLSLKTPNVSFGTHVLPASFSTNHFAKSILVVVEELSISRSRGDYETSFNIIGPHVSTGAGGGVGGVIG